MAPAAYTLEQLAREIGGRVLGDPARVVRGVASLERAGPEDLSFLTHPRYRERARATRAGALLVGPGGEVEGRDLLEVPQPYVALAALLGLFHPVERPLPEVSPRAHVGRDVVLGREVAVGPFAVLEERAEIGDRAIVGAGCVVGRGSRVGQATELRPGVVLYPGTWVGARCLIHSGVVLGGDGFGFATAEGRHVKLPQVGRVVIEDDVEIGANSAIDRATLDETRIGAGSKLDDLVLVGHGAQLGAGCLLAGQVGIAGSTRVGHHTVFAGQSGAAGHLEIPPGTIVGAKSALLADPPRPGFVLGIPAVDHRAWKRAQAELRHLADLRREVQRMQRRLGEIECRLGGKAGGDEER